MSGKTKTSGRLKNGDRRPVVRGCSGRVRTKFGDKQKVLLEMAFEAHNRLNVQLIDQIKLVTGLDEQVIRNYWQNSRKKLRDGPTRTRTYIDCKQKICLEKAFRSSDFLSEQLKEQLTEETGLSAKVIGNWWHNRKKMAKKAGSKVLV